MIVDPHCRLADPAEVEAALAHALIRVPGTRRRTTDAHEIMSRIVADTLADMLTATFDVMQRPPERGGSALGFGFQPENKSEI